jgi:hypothetical protein
MANAPDAKDPLVRATALAANLRAITVNLDNVDPGSMGLEQLLKRVDRIVDLFLDKHWRLPRRYSVIQPMSYVLFQGPDDPTFVEDAEELTQALEQHLFGMGQQIFEVKNLTGPQEDMIELARRETTEFLSRHERERPQQAQARAAQTTVAAERPPQPTWRGDLSFFAGYFAPKRALISFVAGLRTEATPLALVPYEDTIARLGENAIDFERAALVFAARKLTEQAKQGSLPYCIVPVSHQTLIERARRELYLADARKCPEPLRRFMVASIVGAPPAPSSTSVIELLERLRPFFPLVDWRTSNPSISLAPFQNARPFAVTFCQPRGNTAFDAVGFARLARDLKAMSIRPGVADVKTRIDLKTAIVAGAQFLSGPAVSGPVGSLVSRSGVEVDHLPLLDGSRDERGAPSAERVAQDGAAQAHS